MVNCDFEIDINVIHVVLWKYDVYRYLYCLGKVNNYYIFNETQYIILYKALTENKFREGVQHFSCIDPAEYSKVFTFKV